LGRMKEKVGREDGLEMSLETVSFGVVKVVCWGGNVEVNDTRDKRSLNGPNVYCLGVVDFETRWCAVLGESGNKLKRLDR